MRILLTIPRASYVEGKVKRSIEDEGTSVLIGNMASKEGRMNNKTSFQSLCWSLLEDWTPKVSVTRM